MYNDLKNIYDRVFKETVVLKYELREVNDMADRNISPSNKNKPLTKKERKERKRKRKEKHVYE